ncbi:Stk1 family PASTA domain-containing Ser/Thr kinase [Nocardioides cynanchi]|uniref:Stk1 family PASTA domain-containing Ser/Thr kinase n=1 Tax=Nocardioides cynanchi TaxID=2558918 RepID=UPI001248A0EB|nr:Stk1 family PASTA domain-containing Ser/Thr kinase [Nocardioides cynanchi]
MEQESRAHAGSAVLADPLSGQVLDGRYRIGRRIARGGMAGVYEALDTRLDRICAVKVMHPGLGDDEAFAARFVREARSAARLSHPHVVNVFDQGEDPTVDGGTLYLVMELISGHTLRDVIRDEAPVPPARALALIEPVVSALAAAHRAGLIHRDIKPENVLIADDGRVKVADFGLAKAVSADTQHTATGGVIIGTVSYLAPELVVDGTSDARADVYAAGVVLYELLTGSKPHEGESPIAVAYKHVHEDVPPPSRSAPGIPAYLDALVARATARDRAQRPADAGVLLHQLHRVSQALASGAWADHELTTDLALTPLSQSVGSAPVTEDTSDLDLVPMTPAEFVSPEPQPTTVRSVPPPSEPPTTPVRGRRSRRGPVLLGLALVIALLAGVGAYWFGWARYTATPGVLGLTQQAATHKLEKAGLHVTVGAAAFSSSVPKGEVVGTDPGPGARVLDHGTVTLTLSKGQELYAVPQLRNLTVNQAQDALLRSHLTYGRSIRQYDEKVARGHVIGSNPSAGKRESPKTLVDLVVSRGPQPIHIRDWTGAPAARAEQVLKAQHLDVVLGTAEYSDQVAQGHVLSQTPPSGVLHRGDQVTLVVSKGPQLVPVPDNLTAMGVAAATAELKGLGFQVSVVKSPYYIGVGYVYSSSPGGGEMAPKGSVVVLHII